MSLDLPGFRVIASKTRVTDAPASCRKAHSPVSSLGRQMDARCPASRHTTLLSHGGLCPSIHAFPRGGFRKPGTLQDPRADSRPQKGTRMSALSLSTVLTQTQLDPFWVRMDRIREVRRSRDENPRTVPFQVGDTFRSPENSTRRSLGRLGVGILRE